MNVITTTDALEAYCTEARKHPYVTVDTEFLRERTYYSKLCLVQLAMPGTEEENACLVDPLAEGISLEPLYDLLRDENVVKVFHAARQDIEIFFVSEGVIPSPLFDTQVASMVCGFGEQVGYETLVRKIAKASVDKSSRFTDWSRRPLSDAQMKYALADVTHLRQIYEFLARKLERDGRAHWVSEEMGILTAPETYTANPKDAWKRVKTRNAQPRFLAIVRELAEFREAFAQKRDVPRNRVYKDDALTELAATKPKSHNDLGRSRLLLREARKGDIADGILAAVKRGLECPEDALPKVDGARDKLQVNPALADLLRVLLKAKTSEFNVAPKLIASAADLDAMAAGIMECHALHGWRAEVFGEDAQRLINGEVGLAVKGQNVKLFNV